MILQIHLNDNDLRTFFDRAGYITKMETLTYYSNGYHGKLIESEKDVLMVVTPTRLIPAHELYENLMHAMAVNPCQRTVSELDKLVNDENKN